MRIDVRYFASVREKLGAGESLHWPQGEGAPRTVAQLLSHLVAQSPLHAAALDGDRCLRTAVNQALCELDEPLFDGAEVAFFPPVTGG